MTQPGQLELVDDLDIEEPGLGEVLVEVAWCSLCHSDLHALDGVTPAPLPGLLGHEAAGVVRQLGPGVQSLTVGDHVVLTMIGPCGRCSECLRNVPVACVRADGRGGLTADGSTRISRHGERVWRTLRVGALAEFAVLRAEAVVRIDKELPLDLACILGCAFLTGYGAIRNIAQVRTGDRVGVIGLGAVGIAAIQTARIAGASGIVGVDPLMTRRELASKVGANWTLAPDEVSPRTLAELTEGLLLDVVIDTVCTAGTISQAVGLVSRGGAVVLVGVTSAQAELTVPIADLVMNQTRILGCFLGNCIPARDIADLVQLWRQGQLDLDSMVTARRTLDEVSEAFDDLRQGRGLRIAISISPENASAC